MIEEQQDQYYNGRHTFTHLFKSNLPFTLNSVNQSWSLTFEDVIKIDSVYRDESLVFDISKQNRKFDPIELYFENRDQSKSHEPIDTHSEYTLFAYLNNTKYYLARGKKYAEDDNKENYMLVLTSIKNKDMIKGNNK